MDDGFRCFVLEDDDSVAEVLEKLLNRSGGQVHRFKRLDEAREGLSGCEWDLFILDHNLPDGQGTDFFEALRENGDYTPVILMTGDFDFKVSKESQVNGFFAYIPKPCQWPLLKECMQRAGIALVA